MIPVRDWFPPACKFMGRTSLPRQAAPPQLMTGEGPKESTERILLESLGFIPAGGKDGVAADTAPRT